MHNSKETVSSPTQNWCKYELIETVAAHTRPAQVQDRQRSQGREGEVDTSSIPNQEAVCKWYLPVKGKSVFSNDFHWVYHPYTMAEMMSNHNFLTQIRFHSYLCAFVFFFFLIVFSFPNFCCSYLDVFVREKNDKIS